jgi:hypothetical protein
MPARRSESRQAADVFRPAAFAVGELRERAQAGDVLEDRLQEALLVQELSRRRRRGGRRRLRRS